LITLLVKVAVTPTLMICAVWLSVTIYALFVVLKDLVRQIPRAHRVLLRSVQASRNVVSSESSLAGSEGAWMTRFANSNRMPAT
jgi:hypothetical protein